MIELKSDCVILDGVFCKGHKSEGRWFCPRAIYSWWRDDWLERAEAEVRAQNVTTDTVPQAAAGRHVCRLCGSELRETLVDLGSSPPCESFLRADQLNEAEPFYPLHVWICGECMLAQLEEYVAPSDIFEDYAYFSAYSSSWVEHARRYTER